MDPNVDTAAGKAWINGEYLYRTGLRRALGPEAPRLRSPTSATLRFDLDGAAVDLIAFDAALSRGDPAALEEAVSLYRGPLLEGWADEGVFEERQAREQAHLDALEKLAIHAIERQDLGTAERHLRQAVAVDPLRENAQRALMQTLAAAGRWSSGRCRPSRCWAGCGSSSLRPSAGSGCRSCCCWPGRS